MSNIIRNNIGANDSTWDFISSQAISGGTIVGGLNHPYSYYIYKDNDTYKSVSNKNILPNLIKFYQSISNYIAAGINRRRWNLFKLQINNIYIFLSFFNFFNSIFKTSN